ncbi:MAG: methyltransferase domain-containing protein [Dehalococcoidales bacterium]|nr:methyltransferase domain-containing protein [Dehalococcoidales bacterium]
MGWLIVIKEGEIVRGLIELDYTKPVDIWDPVGMRTSIDIADGVDIQILESVPDGLKVADKVLKLPSEDSVTYSKSYAPSKAKNVPAKVNLITTVGVKCGIATYSKFLGEAVRKKFPVAIHRNVMDANSSGIIHVQHEFGIFPHVDELLTRQLETCYGIVTWHTVFRDPGPQLGVYQAIDAIYDGHIVHSVLAKKWLSRYVSKPIYVIPHGSSEIQPISQAAARRILGISPDGPLVFMFGFAADSKGFAEVAEVAGRAPNFEFYISGAVHGVVEEHSEDSRAKLLAAAPDNVMLLGRYLTEEEIDTWACAADIFLFNYNTPPGISSASGALHRILWAGRPVICTSDNRMSDLEDGSQCLKYEHFDYDEMLRLLRLVASDKQLAVQLGQAAKAFAQKTSWDAVAQLHLDAYGAIMGQVYGPAYYDEEYFVGSGGGKVHTPDQDNGRWSYYNTTGEWLGAEDVMLAIRDVLTPDRVLDVGCGRGTFVGWGSKLGMAIRGIDFSPWAVQHPYPGATGLVEYGNAVDIPYPSKSVDLVLAFDLLEHIYEDELATVIGELERVSSKYVMYNIAVCEAGQEYSLRKDQLPDKEQMVTAVPGHVHMETQEYWERVLTASGGKLRYDLVERFRGMVPPEVLGNWKCIIVVEHAKGD